ncbi:MAG TPA: DUF5131 family protein, partial [Phycisphaerae bacterium]|nr:DUF5131 family protein [Phycisphaerae bacterium]
ADKRIPDLLRSPATVRFLSCEPLLGDLDIRQWLGGVDIVREHGSRGKVIAHARDGISWVIVGGESGHGGARPCNVEWIRSVVSQCREAGVACFVKQLGAQQVRLPDGEYWGPAHALVPHRDPKGGDPDEWPEDLRVREWPRP